MTLTIGNALRQEIDEYARSLVQSNELFLATVRGALTAEHIRAYVRGVLLQLRGSMDALRKGARRAFEDGDRALAEHYRHKTREEEGHDLWAERDLVKLTSSGTTDGRHPDSPAMTRLVDYLDRLVDRDPCLFLAYILLSEYITVLVGPPWLEALENKCGIPRNRVTVIANHVELDGEHVTEGVDVIDRLVSPHKLEAMLEVVRTSFSYYELFWNEILSITATQAA